MAPQPPSVCIDMQSVPAGSLNGTGVYALELLRRLPGDVSVFVRGEEQRAAFQALGVRTLETLAELQGCQILHRPAQIYDRAVLDLFLNAPALPVISCLDLISYRTPALFRSFEAYRSFRGMLFASLSSAQAVIAISQHGRREILEEFHLPPERVHCTPLGVDVSFFGSRDAASNAAVLRKHGLAGAYFLHAGTDLPHKNLALLLRGYAWMRKLWSGPDALPQLVLIGARSGAPGAIFDAGSEPAAGVRYLGAVERNEVAALYQEALALVYPSAYEGFGLPVLEAMAAGVPVLSSRMSSIPEAAGDAALYLEELSMDEVAQRMMDLARDADLRRRLIEAGRKRAEALTWTETARRTAEIHAAVAANPAPDPNLQRRVLRELEAARR
jgi:glycosyltransferase involved in cell wall biosynthesis